MEQKSKIVFIKIYELRSMNSGKCSEKAKGYLV